MNYEQDSLTLGLGFPSTTTTIKPTTTTTTVKPLSCNLNEPSLTLSLLGGEAAPCSAASSMSNVVVSVKRERESGSNTSDELDNIIDHRGYSRGSDEEEDGGCHVNATRKKLRLNKQQSAMLEESFKQQSTLNPKQKQALADRLNLRPRQVEVWFQNRRARTKLKQTEVDCEYLKKYCETLSDENMKLQKEVQELKALKSAQPFYMHLPAATLTMCPSCERIGTGSPNNNIVAPTTPANNNNPFSMGPKTHRFFTSVPTRPLLVDN